MSYGEIAFTVGVLAVLLSGKGGSASSPYNPEVEHLEQVMKRNNDNYIDKSRQDMLEQQHETAKRLYWGPEMPKWK